MKKTFVLDTNVLVHDPEAILRFEENDIILGITVIEELDSLKKGHGEISFSARQSLRLIDSLRTNGEKLYRGIRLPGGGLLRIAVDESLHLSKPSADNRIISLAVDMSKSRDVKQPVIVVSKDTSVRIKAEAMGLLVQDYTNDKTSLFMKYGRVLNGDAENYINGINSVRYQISSDRIFRLSGGNGSLRIEPVRRNRPVAGISPKNTEQECAFDALLSDRVSIVALTGNAGTGKTLLALAAGFYLCTKSKRRPATEYVNAYEQVVVGRPVVPMGNDIGYLPGSVEEKLTPWMQPIYDNLDIIINTPSEGKDGQIVSYRGSEYLVNSDIIHIEPLTYIRGRSLPRRYLIIDEAQNLRPLEVKTIITRCGEGTKVVFTGDLDQIDNPFLDATSNGLAYLISRFINEEDFCYLNLTRGARSVLAERAARLL